MMRQDLGGILFAGGILVSFIGIVILFTVDYNTPPIPFGYIVGLTLIIIGFGLLVASINMAIHYKEQCEQMTKFIFFSLIAAGIVIYGIILLVQHPLELPNCPCLANFYGQECTECPKFNQVYCNGHGVCDDGLEGSGECFCDRAWAGETCELCSDSFEPKYLGEFVESCDTCKRNWDGDYCDRCYPGYTGPNCDVCAEGWIPEVDELGVLCRKCKPGHWGGYCEPCRDCKEHDPQGICRDNDWHEENIYRFTRDSCTPEGKLCTDKYDCGSFNCKGICVFGDETSGLYCEFDGDCGFGGTCEYKQCCLESRHGNGHCECGSLGYYGEDCQACPGFDGVYTETICTGHGTCVAKYVEEEYTGLVCECVPQGTTPFPAWTGETCSCLKETTDQNNCTECATGSWGPQCQSCPGGSGISQCNMHGICNDGVTGDGTCDCYVDIKYNGLGGFGGDSCSVCASNDFWGDRCKTCPKIRKEAPQLDGKCPANKYTFADGDCTGSCTFGTTCNTNNGQCEI